MGVIKEAPKSERETPEFPEELADVYGHYKRLRFGIFDDGDRLNLMARDPLKYAEVESYARLADWHPTQTDVAIIMDIDAIFESREVK